MNWRIHFLMSRIGTFIPIFENRSGFLSLNLCAPSSPIDSLFQWSERKFLKLWQKFLNPLIWRYFSIFGIWTSFPLNSWAREDSWNCGKMWNWIIKICTYLSKLVIWRYFSNSRSYLNCSVKIPIYNFSHFDQNS